MSMPTGSKLKQKVVAEWRSRIGIVAADSIWMSRVVLTLIAVWWLMSSGVGIVYLCMGTRGIGLLGIPIGVIWTGVGIWLSATNQKHLKRSRIEASRKISYDLRRVIVVPRAALRSIAMFDRWHAELRRKIMNGE